MRAVGVRELKNRLSEHLQAVKQGEQILITDRGQVIAELRQPTAYSDQGGLAPALASMMRERTIEVGLPNSAEADPAQPRRVPDGTAVRVLGELCDERRSSPPSRAPSPRTPRRGASAPGIDAGSSDPCQC